MLIEDAQFIAQSPTIVDQLHRALSVAVDQLDGFMGYTDHLSTNEAKEALTKIESILSGGEK